MTEAKFTPITPTQLAEELNADPKTVRRIMRSITARDDQPGSGARWTIESQAAKDAIVARFNATHHRKTVSFRPIAD